MTDPKSIEKLSFEEALQKLEQIVNKIDTGQEDLANAVKNFEHGILLKKHCEKLLNDAKLKIEKILQKENDEQIFEEVKF